MNKIRITIRGAVQGVGFRPYVFRLAEKMRVKGWVSNSLQGILIEAEGPKPLLDEFLIRVQNDRPPRASIHSLEFSFLDPSGFTKFEIRTSKIAGIRTAFVLPDIATCGDCLAEIFNPKDRRYHYPFTNCTNCGPRFTIIDSLPYDRANTTMRAFSMCEECRREYENPMDRRFHAQPNACHECGPQLELWDEQSRVLADRHSALLGAVRLIKAGGIVAVKGLGGFHLLVDAANQNAVTRLRQRKQREEKPFAVMVPGIEWARQLCVVEALAERALLAPEAPIVLLERSDGGLPFIANAVASNNPTLGIMLPSDPLHHLLMKEMDQPVVATSGNRGGDPVYKDERIALEKLGDVADALLVHNRPIRRHADDSIVRILLGREQILRRARGYAPLPITLKQSAPSQLAVGAHLKNTVALAIPAEARGETNVFISQHIGDLETDAAFSAFTETIEDMQQLYQVQPTGILSDLHPDYVSSQFVEGCGDRIQHHSAHVASCMAENALYGPVLGVAWDGAGYGSDGTIWGGEFLLARNGEFKRVAHLRTFPLPGGDAAARRPRHTAAGVLFEILGEQAWRAGDPPLLSQMLKKGIRSPRTSSAGRLFDAVASLTGLRHETTFEGQAAMDLEFAIDPSVGDSYPFAIQKGDPHVVDWEPMLLRILDDLDRGAPAGVIAARFHNTLAEIIVNVAVCIDEPKIALTGGCFQNRYLMERTVRRLTETGFHPYWHQRVPPNDGGIALGQVAAAYYLMENIWASQYQAK
jgi:hydrogenase maturation protein HypF